MRWRRRIDRWNIFWLALALGGCAIADSTIVDLGIPYAPGNVVCNSSLGSYALPRSYIRVVVGKTKDGPPDIIVPANLGDTQFNFQVVRRADPTLTICLDYLASIFANDEITVIKQKVGTDDGTDPKISRQFLQTVIFNAADRSVQIARNLIQAAFVGASGNPNFGPERSFIKDNVPNQILADLEFDPFDTHASAEANGRLAPLGICLVLEGFTFDRGSMTIDQYCNAPSRVRGHLPRVAELYAIKSREPVPPNTAGILYRPRQPYMISVYRKVDPRGRGPWALSHRVETELENLSPVISVGLTRAAFARRNAILKFDDGTLLTACIAKSSEIENFVAIPFEVARALVALPSQIIQVKINTTMQQNELARMQEVFIRTQAALIQAQLKNKKQDPVSAGSGATIKAVEMDPLLKNTVKALSETANTFTFANNDQKLALEALCASDIFKASKGDLAPAPILPFPPAGLVGAQ